MKINQPMTPFAFYPGTVRYERCVKNRDDTFTFYFTFIPPDFPSYRERLENGDCEL